MDVRKFSKPPLKPKDRLAQIAEESEKQEEGRVKKWLDLAKRFFEDDPDDGPSPRTA